MSQRVVYPERPFDEQLRDVVLMHLIKIKYKFNISTDFDDADALTTRFPSDTQGPEETRRSKGGHFDKNR